VRVETDGSGVFVFVEDILSHLYYANISMMLYLSENIGHELIGFGYQVVACTTHAHPSPPQGREGKGFVE